MIGLGSYIPIFTLWLLWPTVLLPQAGAAATVLSNLNLRPVYRGDTNPGSVWPQPYQQTTNSLFQPVLAGSFQFSLTPRSYSCDILEEAFARYRTIIKHLEKSPENDLGPDENRLLKTLDVSLLQPCEQYPYLGMNETYGIFVFEGHAQLTGDSIWGILRGLETFSQLLWENNGQIVINETAIYDYPRFAHRGILLDTSRHFLPDAMAYNKFNVFHWHIVDDQSFPYASEVYPKLSEKMKKSNPDISAYMLEHNITGNYSALEQIYIKKVLNISEKNDFKTVVWQEVFDNGVQINKDTMVEVWKNWLDYQAEVANVTEQGYKTIIAAPWYLDQISRGQDWIKYYSYEPLNFTGTPEQKQLVAGGEACLWGEFVDSTNLLPRLWPRASAIAERLWSPQKVKDTYKAAPRLHHHRCNLLARGIPAEPMQRGFCPHDLLTY